MFSRDELLGGMPARRASTILFAIEAHTARLIAGSRVQRAAYVGRRDEATTLLTVAKHLARHCGATRVHDEAERRLRELADPVPSTAANTEALSALTNREWQVAQIAGTGKTTREIARSLCMRCRSIHRCDRGRRGG